MSDYRRTEVFPKELKEKEVQKQVMQYLIMNGYLVVRINSGAFIESNRYIRAYIIANNGKSSGLPDVLAMKQGKGMLLEIKAGRGGKVSDKQKDFISLARSKGVDVYVINSLDQVIDIVEKL